MPRGLVLLLGAAAAVITVAGIRAAAWLVAPTLLALVIVIVVSPVIKWLRGRGVPAWAATLALVLLVYGVLVAFGVVVIASFANLAALLSRYGDRLQALVVDVTEVLGRLGVGPAQLRYVADALDVGKVLSALGSLLVDLTGMTTSVVFLLGLLLFLSVEASGIDTRLLEIAAHRPHSGVAMQGFARRTRRYLVATTIFGLIVAALDAVALAWMGIPLVVLWGLLAFVTNYVPNVGFVLGLLPPALLALVISLATHADRHPGLHGRQFRRAIVDPAALCGRRRRTVRRDHVHGNGVLGVGTGSVGPAAGDSGDITDHGRAGRRRSPGQLGRRADSGAFPGRTSSIAPVRLVVGTRCPAREEGGRTCACRKVRPSGSRDVGPWLAVVRHDRALSRSASPTSPSPTPLPRCGNYRCPTARRTSRSSLFAINSASCNDNSATDVHNSDLRTRRSSPRS
jgi:predicted PurR-regulated permease PerM